MLYVLYDILRTRLESAGIGWAFSILDQLEFRALAALALAFAIVVLFGRRAIGLLVRLKVGDAGLSDADALRTHAAGKANTPTMGGLLIAVAIAAATLLLADLRNEYVRLALVVIAWLGILGGMDDYLKLTAAARGAGSRQGLYAWEKLVFQLGLGLLIGYFAFAAGDDPQSTADLAHVINLPLQKTFQTTQGPVSETLFYLPLAAYVVLMMLMTAGMSNAVNITDGMDGLATGAAAVVAIGLMILAFIDGTQKWAQYLLVPYVANADELAVIAGAMGGACLGFLWWNCSPAQVFMGDTGSLLLGGLIGFTAVVLRQEIVVLIMSGLFLLEIATVVIQVAVFKYTRIRTGTGKRVFRVAPYHHHLHMGGWTEPQVVARLWIVSILFVVLALATIKLR